MPSLQLKSIGLVSSTFEMTGQPPSKESEGKGLSFSIGGGHDFDSGSRLLKVDVAVKSPGKGNAEEVPFRFEVWYQGVFQVSGEVDDQGIEKLAHVNCAAIVFPYLREHVSDLTRRANLPPVTLPVVNFVRVYEEEILGRRAEKPSEDNRS